MSSKVLLLVSRESRDEFLGLLQSIGMDADCAEDLPDAIARLKDSADCELILADAHLPAGSWRDLLEFTTDAKRFCALLVCSRSRDHELHEEVSRQGAFNLIADAPRRRSPERHLPSALESRQRVRPARKTMVGRSPGSPGMGGAAAPSVSPDAWIPRTGERLAK